MKKNASLIHTPITKGFGPHLMMDCRNVSREKCTDLNYIWQFLNDLPDEIGMTKITQPYVFPYSGLIPEDAGVTGMVIIAESHLSFHSFIHKDYFFFDLFSCKAFDVDRVAKRVIEVFDVKEPTIHRVDRGVDFPRDEHDVIEQRSSSMVSFPKRPHDSASQREALLV